MEGLTHRCAWDGCYLGPFWVGLLGCGELEATEAAATDPWEEMDLIKDRLRNLSDFQTCTELEVRTIWSRVLQQRERRVPVHL